MSVGGGPVDLAVALELGRRAAELIAPTVIRCKAAGSLRRRRERLGDIEFVVEPLFEQDLFDPIMSKPALEDLKRTLRGMGRWRKGGDRYMQITDLFGVEGLRLEVFAVHPPAQWGSILAIRTGPKELGEYCVTVMKGNGLRHVDGHIENRKGEVVPTPTEEDFFAAAGVDCVPPAQRDQLAEQLLGGRYHRFR